MKVWVACAVLFQLVWRICSQFTFDRALYNDSVEIKDLLKDVLRRLDVTDNVETYKDCTDLKAKKPATPDGVYEITTLYSRRTMKVYCDMTSDGGKGWTVLQRRQDGSVNFTRNWFQYKYGFGDLNGEFWLGNDNIYHVTNQDLYRAKIELVNFGDVTKNAIYSTFYIGAEDTKYKLSLGKYIASGRGLDAGDALTTMHNGMNFTTWDQDNDRASGTSCVTHAHYRHGGGWWFGNCDTANLNAEYLKTWRNTKGSERNIEWGRFTNSVYWIKRTVLKIRPASEFD